MTLICSVGFFLGRGGGGCCVFTKSNYESEAGTLWWLCPKWNTDFWRAQRQKPPHKRLPLARLKAWAHHQGSFIRSGHMKGPQKCLWECLNDSKCVRVSVPVHTGRACWGVVEVGWRAANENGEWFNVWAFSSHLRASCVTAKFVKAACLHGGLTSKLYTSQSDRHNSSQLNWSASSSKRHHHKTSMKG